MSRRSGMESRRPRPRLTPARSTLFQPCPVGPRLGLVRITVGTVSVDYWLSRLPTDFGAAFRLERLAPVGDEPAAYDVLLAEGGGAPSCECKGFFRWGRCKHADGLLALLQAGRL
jgi:hypothetical protein